jgi:hypothetical protein
MFARRQGAQTFYATGYATEGTMQNTPLALPERNSRHHPDDPMLKLRHY